MAVLKRRARLVTFRVSNEEYDILQNVCLKAGFRSLSDFARSAVNYRALVLSAPQRMLSEDLSTLSSELAALDETLNEMRERIGRLLGPAADNSSPDMAGIPRNRPVLYNSRVNKSGSGGE
jgi:hypothetical protein